MQRFHFDELDSTNTKARELAGAHPGERLLVTAATQTCGRGRHGRAWASPRGGVWMTLVWPAAREAAFYEPMPLVVGLAVREAVAGEACDGFDDARLKIKWPNDVLLDGMKVAGVLCERTLVGGAAPEAASAAVILIGVGINADFEPAMLPTDLRTPATTLRHVLGRGVEAQRLTAACSAAVEQHVMQFDQNGFAGALRDRVNETIAWRGRWVQGARDGLIEGVLESVDDRGRLLLGGVSNQSRLVQQGEVDRLSVTPWADTGCGD